MKIINNVNQKNMVIAMKKEANKKFTACNPEKCPTLQNIRWLILQEKSPIIVEVRTDLQKLDLKISQLEVGTIFNYNGAF